GILCQMPSLEPRLTVLVEPSREPYSQTDRHGSGRMQCRKQLRLSGRRSLLGVKPAARQSVRSTWQRRDWPVSQCQELRGITTRTFTTLWTLQMEKMKCTA